jgi:hypothetical protein
MASASLEVLLKGKIPEGLKRVMYAQALLAREIFPEAGGH